MLFPPLSKCNKDAHQNAAIDSFSSIVIPFGGRFIKKRDVQLTGSHKYNYKETPHKWDLAATEVHSNNVKAKIGFGTKGDMSLEEPSLAGGLHTEGFENYNWGETPPTRERPVTTLASPSRRMAGVPVNLDEVAKSFELDCRDEGMKPHRGVQVMTALQSQQRRGLERASEDRDPADQIHGRGEEMAQIVEKGEERVEPPVKKKEMNISVSEIQGIILEILNILKNSEKKVDPRMENSREDQAEREINGNIEDVKVKISELSDLLTGTKHGRFGRWWFKKEQVRIENEGLHLWKPDGADVESMVSKFEIEAALQEFCAEAGTRRVNLVKEETSSLSPLQDYNGTHAIQKTTPIEREDSKEMESRTFITGATKGGKPSPQRPSSSLRLGELKEKTIGRELTSEEIDFRDRHMKGGEATERLKSSEVEMKRPKSTGFIPIITPTRFNNKAVLPSTPVSLEPTSISPTPNLDEIRIKAEMADNGGRGRQNTPVGKGGLGTLGEVDPFPMRPLSQSGSIFSVEDGEEEFGLFEGGLGPGGMARRVRPSIGPLSVGVASEGRVSPDDLFSAMDSFGGVLDSKEASQKMIYTEEQHEKGKISAIGGLPQPSLEALLAGMSAIVKEYPDAMARAVLHRTKAVYSRLEQEEGVSWIELQSGLVGTPFDAFARWLGTPHENNEGNRFFFYSSKKGGSRRSILDLEILKVASRDYLISKWRPIEIPKAAELLKTTWEPLDSLSGEPDAGEYEHLYFEELGLYCTPNLQHTMNAEGELSLTRESLERGSLSRMGERRHRRAPCKTPLPGVNRTPAELYAATRPKTGTLNPFELVPPVKTGNGKNSPGTAEAETGYIAENDELDWASRLGQDLEKRNKSRQGKPWEIEADPKLTIQGSMNSFTQRTPLPEIGKLRPETPPAFKGMLKDTRHKELKAALVDAEERKEQEESLKENAKVKTLEVQLMERATEQAEKNYEEKATENDFLVIDHHSGHVVRPSTTTPTRGRSPSLLSENAPLPDQRRKNDKLAPKASPGLLATDKAPDRASMGAKDVAMNMISNAVDPASVNAILTQSDVVSAQFQL